MSERLVCYYQLNPDGGFSERVRTLRAFLLHRQHLCKSLLFTSCWPQEGKSTVCLNLAAALSEFGLKVLLIDADLRRASLTRHLGKWPFRSDGSGLQEPQELGDLPRVHFLSLAQSAAEDPAVSLTGWTDRIGAQLAAYDFVLTDSPCLSVCKDAYFTRGWARQAVVVVDPGRFRGTEEGHMVEDLRDQGFEVVGSVLSRLRQG